MQNQPHRWRPENTHCVCQACICVTGSGGVTQLDWGRHWTFTAALGKCALEASSQCSVTHTKSMLTHHAHCSLKREQELKMAYLCPHISHHSSSTSRVGCKQNTRPTIQQDRRSHLYFCKCMVVDWLWLAASWNWAPAFKLIFVFFSTSASVPWTLFREWVERRFPWILKTSLHCVPLWMCVHALKK